MPEEQAAPSIADSLASAIETVEKAPVTTPDAAPAPAAPTTPEAAPATPASSEKGGRDSQGRFLKKATSDTPSHVGTPPTADQKTVPVAPKIAKPVVEDKSAVPPTAAAAPTDAPPPAWKDTTKAKWSALDQEVREEIQRRERDITIGLQRAADARKFGDGIMQEFAPYMEVLTKEGATPQAAIRALLETTYTLRYGSQAHKHALFLSLADQYGIDLTQQVNPQLARTEWELDSSRQRDMRAAAENQTRNQQEIAQTVESFISAPGHEHYETVRPMMAGLLQSGAAKDLQDAYDQACWANPSVRVAMQQAENIRRAGEQEKNRVAANSTVTGAPGAVGVTPGVDPKNMRAMIESQFKDTSGRV